MEAELVGAQEARQLDAFGLYLYSLLLIDRDRKEQARQVLIASVCSYPCNWMAWQVRWAAAWRGRGQELCMVPGLVVTSYACITFSCDLSRFCPDIKCAHLQLSTQSPPQALQSFLFACNAFSLMVPQPLFSPVIPCAHRQPSTQSPPQALQSICVDDAQLVSVLPLPAHWVRDFFLASLCLEMQHNSEALSRLQTISQLFPASSFVTSQAAQAHYSLRNFDHAEQLFADIIQRDPYKCVFVIIIGP